jgi:hypothetical protein
MRTYLPRHYAIRVALRIRKACSRRPIKYRRDVWAGRSQWFATVPSGSTTLGRQRGQAGSYSATATRCQCREPSVRNRYRPSDVTTPHHTADRVQGGRRQDLACPHR